MWAIHNETAYATDRTWVRDKHGRHHWVVVAKATFNFTPYGALCLADEQLPPLHEPEYFGEPGKSSLRYEADLIARKPGTDVVVNAHAHAPGGRPTQEVVVGLRVGELEKALLVRGESTYGFRRGSEPSISSPRPFISRPIRYEYAYGGIDKLDKDPQKHRIDLRNPVGVGVASRIEHLYGRAAPSVYYPRGNPSKVGPAGFGAIASYWSPRLELGGTYDQNWAAKKKPLLPDDYDDAQLLCSPTDQRPRERLRGGERIGLVNVTPEGACIMELPRIVLLATTRISRRRSEHPLELSTVVLEPEEQRLIMVWQGALCVAWRDVEYLDESRIRERAV